MTSPRALPLALLLLAGAAQSAPVFPYLEDAPPLVETPLAGDGSRTTVHRLSNGLTVFLSPDSQSPRVAAHIVVRAGSKNDPADSTGMAHYLEHMLFKGTESLGTLDYAAEKPHLERIQKLYEEHFRATDPAERARLYKEIDAENVAASKSAVPNEISKVYSQLGIRGVNAFTSDEQTVYVCDFPSNRAEAWATVESERFAHPVFRLFQGELETVYEEKNRSLDNAGRILAEALNSALYKGHPYGRTTLGSIEHLKNPSLKKMHEFYARWYRPNNMAIALAGDFDRAAMLALLEKSFGAWKPVPLDALRTPPIPALKGEEKVEVKYEAEETVELVWRGVPYLNPDRDALRVMGLMLSNGRTGIIDLTLNQKLKVRAAGAGAYSRNEAGELVVWAVPKLGQTLEEARALLLDAVATLKAGGFSDDDLKATVLNFEIGEKAQLESNESRVNRMEASFIRREPWSRTVEGLDRIRRVTKADVLRVAAKYLGDDRVLAYRRKGKPSPPSIAKPAFTKIDIDAARRSAFAEKVLALPAEPLTPRFLVKDRDYRVTPAPAGNFYAAGNPFNDLVTVSYVFKRGKRQERQLCTALSLLNLAGAGELSAEEYKRKLYALGASVYYSCGEDFSSVAFTGIEANLDATAALVKARFDAPVLSTTTLKDYVTVTRGARADAKKDPGAISHALAMFARYGKDSPVLAELSDAELAGLDVEKLKKLVRGAFAYRRRTAYVGNRPVPDAAKLLASDAPTKTPAERVPRRMLTPKKSKVYFAHREMVQAQGGLFAADGRFDPSHAVDESVYSSYVGGGMGSLIFQEMREARSLAYSASGGYSRGGLPGDDNEVYGVVGSQADKTVDALTLLGDLVRRPPAAERRFAEAKKTLEEGYRDNVIFFRHIPSAVIDWEDEGLNGDPRPERFQKLLGYEMKGLTGFAQRLKDKTLTYYVLGSRDRVDLKGLGKLGEVEEKTLEQIFPY